MVRNSSMNPDLQDGGSQRIPACKIQFLLELSIVHGQRAASFFRKEGMMQDISALVRIILLRALRNSDLGGKPCERSEEMELKS